jgi:hypothetical protein
MPRPCARLWLTISSSKTRVFLAPSFSRTSLGHWLNSSMRYSWAQKQTSVDPSTSSSAVGDSWTAELTVLGAIWAQKDADGSQKRLRSLGVPLALRAADCIPAWQACNRNFAIEVRTPGGCTMARTVCNLQHCPDSSATTVGLPYSP